MSDMKTEQLQSGQGAIALGAAPQSAEGRNAGGQAGFGEARDLGAGAVAEMFGPAITPLERLRAAGNVEENPAEMGGGGDATDAWVAQKGGYDKLLQQIQQNGWADNAVWNLSDGTKISVAEVKRRAAAAASPPSPEPQPAPRPTDWRDTLQKDQKERLKGFEMNISKLDLTQLQGLLSRIKQLQALAPADGWQGKGIREEDVVACLRVIMERIEETGEQREIIGDIRNITRVARITGWRPPPDEFDPKIDLSTGSTNGA